MKSVYRYFVHSILLSLAALIFMSSEDGRAFEDNVGNTGAPLETQLCSNCHNSGNSFGTVSLSIQVFQQGTTTVVTNYVGGTTYDMKVTVNNSAGSPAGRGFQMTCLTSPGNAPLAGYSNLGTNVQMVTLTTGLYAGRTYVEQPTMSVSNQFNFKWTAPAAGTGTVKFYAAGNAVNGNNGSSGDKSGNTSLTLTEFLPLTQTGNFASPGCFGENNGFIQLTVTGGVFPYTFLWNDGVTTEDRSNLGPGIYSVVITDAAGNTVNQSFTLTEPPLLESELFVTNPIFPGIDGEVNFIITGGTPEYSVEIDDVGVFTTFPIMLGDGLYNYTLSDDAGCTITGEFEVIVPAPLVLEANVVHVSCFGLSDGSASINITGATPPYDVLWSNGDSGLFSDSLGAMVYDVMVTDSVGYNQVFCVTIDQPGPLNGSVSFEPILCNGTTTIINIDASGGTGIYEGTGLFTQAAGATDYLIIDSNNCADTITVELSEPSALVVEVITDTIACSNDVGLVSISASGGIGPYEGTGTFEVLTPGNYQFEVVDSNQCALNVSANVLALDGPVITASTEPTLCSNSCEGAITITLENEIEPFTSMWSDGVEGLSRTDLCIGDYTLTFTDGGGCIINGIYSVEGPDELGIFSDMDPILCSGGSGSVICEATGGTAPFEYTWSNGDTTNSIVVNAGEVSLFLTDFAGCTFSTSFVFTEPEELQNSLTITDVTCYGLNNGAAEIIATGGTMPYHYFWSNNSTDSVATGLSPGLYQYTVTDENGCIQNGEVEILEPEPLEISIVSITPDDESGVGSIDADVNGGTTPYEFEWSNGEFTEDISNLTGGYYDLQVTDAHECTLTLDSVFVETIISTGNILEEFFVIYPNPATDEFVIEQNSILSSIRIFSIDGKLQNEFKTPGMSTRIDARLWNPGVYFIGFNGDKVNAKTRLIVE